MKNSLDLSLEKLDTLETPIEFGDKELGAILGASMIAIILFT